MNMNSFQKTGCPDLLVSMNSYHLNSTLFNSLNKFKRFLKIIEYSNFYVYLTFNYLRKFIYANLFLYLALNKHHFTIMTSFRNMLRTSLRK